MRWIPGGRSENVEDRRGEVVRRRAGGPIGLGLGGVALLVVLSLVTGQNFFEILDDAQVGVDTGSGTDTQQRPHQSSPEEERLVEFVSFVLDDVQNGWQRILGPRYRDAKLVLFTDATRSGCGYAESAMGPFYCPLDQKVYVDLGFYRELRNRFGAPGDFAQAYVIAHEVGHHVQNVLGIAPKVRELQQQYPDQANQWSIRLELQADCLAGVWAHSTQQRQILEQGDVEEGLGAAAAVGDDRIQRGAGGRVNPETWTHGSAEQRVAWFKRGLASGDIESCDTFQQRLPGER